MERKYNESATQRAFIKWIALAHPDVFKVTMAIPNAAIRSTIQGARLKAEGMKKGAPDILILFPLWGLHGMAIEFKHGKNKPTRFQNEMLDNLHSLKYRCVVSYSWEDAAKEVDKYLNNKMVEDLPF